MDTDQYLGSSLEPVLFSGKESHALRSLLEKNGAAFFSKQCHVNKNMVEYVQIIALVPLFGLPFLTFLKRFPWRSADGQPSQMVTQSVS